MTYYNISINIRPLGEALKIIFLIILSTRSGLKSQISILLNPETIFLVLNIYF